MNLNTDYTNKTDEELVILSIENQYVFAHLIDRYQKKLGRYIKRISGLSDDDIEDILQDVFIKTYNNLNAFDQKLKFSSWIYRITHNQVISNFRKINTRPQSVVFEGDDEFLENIASGFDLEKQIDILANKEIILDIISSLDYKYREVLELKFLEEKDYNEISDILKKPKGTIATLINRAKKQVRDELQKKNIKLQ
jgi:RNA polymerase sigma-70 factor (ECF subfamily)